MEKYLIKIIVPVLKSALPMISVQLVDILIDFVHDFSNRAKETSNPFDDIVAELLYACMELLTEEIKKKRVKSS